MSGSPSRPAGRAGIAIGRAREAELPAIAALAAASVGGAFGEAALRAAWSRPEGRLVIARRDARVVGFVCARATAGELEVLSLAVAPDARRRGVARALLAAAAAGAGAVHLEVRAGNAGARAFYVACGFVAVGRRERYYADGEDAIRMSRQGEGHERATPSRGRLAVRANRVEGAEGDVAGAGLRLELELPAAWPAAAAGQFVMLHLAGAGPPRHDPLLPRPMAVYHETAPEAARGGGRALEILYKVVGRGTALMAALAPGDRVGVVGPLGRGFPQPAPGERAILVGGGTGIASLRMLAERTARRAPTSVLLGARRRADVLGLADFEALDVDLRLATEDGSAGHRGLVTELLEAALAEGGPARVFACGPTPMMQRAAALAGTAGAPCWVSLENAMACGIGICLGCAVAGRGEALPLVCRDGPVFETGEIAMEALP